MAANRWKSGRLASAWTSRMQHRAVAAPRPAHVWPSSQADCRTAKPLDGIRGRSIMTYATDTLDTSDPVIFSATCEERTAAAGPSRGALGIRGAHITFSPLLQDLAWLGCTQVPLKVPRAHLQTWMRHVEGLKVVPLRPGTAVVLLQVCCRPALLLAVSSGDCPPGEHIQARMRVPTRPEHHKDIAVPYAPVPFSCLAIRASFRKAHSKFSRSQVFAVSQTCHRFANDDGEAVCRCTAVCRRTHGSPNTCKQSVGLSSNASCPCCLGGQMH
jgi:hypothetical protein